MNKNISNGQWNGKKSGMKEQWEAMKDDDLEDIEVKLEMQSDLLQEFGDVNDESEDHYTIYDK